MHNGSPRRHSRWRDGLAPISENGESVSAIHFHCFLLFNPVPFIVIIVSSSSIPPLSLNLVLQRRQKNRSGDLKTMPLLKNPVLLVSLAILCATTAHAAPTPVVESNFSSYLDIQDSGSWSIALYFLFLEGKWNRTSHVTICSSVFAFLSSVCPFIDLELMTGPLQVYWSDPSLRSPVGRDSEEQRWQKERVAFRQFSEKVVSDHCAGVLESTLDRLDNVRDYIHDRLQIKDSFELLEPVLKPLSWPLRMTEAFHYSVELTKGEIEEEQKKDKEEEKEKRRNPASPPLSPELEEFEQETKRLERMSNFRLRSWTEEKDPQLLLKYRLRQLEKMMALFPYALRFAPDPVREELEETEFVEQTKTLREEVRSLLTCEGVSHVTVAQLGDKLGGYESDNYMDRSAAVRAISVFSGDFRMRLFIQSMKSHWSSMAPYQSKACALRNITQVEDRAPVNKPSEARQQLKDQVVEDQVLFETPEVKFAWTLEAVVRLWRATDKCHQQDPEVAAVMFQE